MDRRKAENAALRDLVNALKQFIRARDGLWSLNFFDRLFRRGKCRRTFQEYDRASMAVRGAIRAVTAATEAAIEEARCETAPSHAVPLVTMEEFEVLLGKNPKPPQRKKLQ